MDSNINVNGNNVPNVDYQNNMNGKKNNGLVVLLVFLLIAAVGFGAFQFGMMYSSKENKIEETKEDNNESEKENKEEKIEEKEPVKNSKYTFYKERKETIKVSEESVEVIAYYYLDEEEMLYDNVKSLYNVIRRDVFINGNKIGETDLAFVLEGNNFVNKLINDDIIVEYKPFMDVYNKKTYLVYFLHDQNSRLLGDDASVGYLDFISKYAYIVGLDGKVLKKILSVAPLYSISGVVVNSAGIVGRTFEVISAEYANNFGLGNDYIYTLYVNSNTPRLDIRDKYIYYVSGDCGQLDEYKLTIDNGELKEEKTATYTEKQILAAGGC